MSEHVSVLLNESIEGLNIKSNGTYVDATLGRAGHSYHILTKLSNLGKLYCFDKEIIGPGGNRNIIESNIN